MNRRFFALFLLLFVTLAVVAAPMNVGENIVETRAKKAVAKAKPVGKSKPVVKPVAKPKLIPKPTSKLKPVSKPAAKSVPKEASAKAKSVGKPKPVVKQVAKPVPKPLAKPVAKKPVAKPATGPNQPAPPTSCPVPRRKPAVRRFLEFIGFSRGLSAPDCTTGSTCCKAQKAAADKAAADANKPLVDGKAESEEPVVQDEPEPVVKPEAEKKPAKPVKKPEPKPAQPVAAPASVLPLAFGKRPVGTVENAPTKGVSCLDRSGEQEKISLADIETAVKLAQAGPLQKPLKPGQRVEFFPHINLPGVCNGKTIDEHAVGRNMAKFHNNGKDLKNFNQFRVVITQPDATGKTTFCGVMTHGTQEMGKFEKALCTELA
ncbi:hypothetical protein B0H13DRAFT_1856849 [Mycena leptocephala]|nr:hypothetical protein B0H13DRAFT_1856849 [Mycena leptocephala]